MRNSVTIKAAWITITGLIVAAIIGLFKCTDGNTVISHGQRDGITAQNITFNNYYENQTPNEKLALEQTLKVKYPLGYIIFTGDEKTIHIPESPSFLKDNVKDFVYSKISLREPGWIELFIPKI